MHYSYERWENVRVGACPMSKFAVVFYSLLEFEISDGLKLGNNMNQFRFQGLIHWGWFFTGLGPCRAKILWRTGTPKNEGWHLFFPEMIQGHKSKRNTNKYSRPTGLCLQRNAKLKVKLTGIPFLHFSDARRRLQNLWRLDDRRLRFDHLEKTQSEAIEQLCQAAHLKQTRPVGKVRWGWLIQWRAVKNNGSKRLPQKTIHHFRFWLLRNVKLDNYDVKFIEKILFTPLCLFWFLRWYLLDLTFPFKSFLTLSAIKI